MTRISRLSLEIYHARRERDANPCAETNARVAAAFEAWNQARKEF
jgi:hypothetical protein